MTFHRITLALVTVLSLMTSQYAFSHGFVSTPASRSLLCKTGENVNCGSVQYEPQSVEGPDGFPELGPADHTIAAAGQSTWAPLNEQSTNRWQKNNFDSGLQVFTWQLTANHVTNDYRYYITKANWNPNKKLTRAAFELDPFCVVDGGMNKPPVKVVNTCYVPERKGYHVILAVWDVGDTAASFYNVIDVQFSGESIPSPNSEPTPPETQPDTTPDSDPDSTPVPDLEPNNSPSPAQGSLTCTAIQGVAADNAWCDLNCNRTPSFCPANFCRCTL